MFKESALPDHKANENHDFAAQDDFLALQKTSPGNEPARYSEREKWEKIKCS